MKSTPLAIADDALLTSEEAATFLRYSGPRALRNFHQWTHRHRVPRLHRGRIPLWRRSVLMAFLERKSWTLVHEPNVIRRHKFAPVKQVHASTTPTKKGSF